MVSGLSRRRIHDPQPQLSFRRTRTGPFQVRRHRALEPFLRVRPRVAQQAQANLSGW